MYKLVLNGVVLDVGVQKQFVKKQLNGISIVCKEQEATGIISSDGEKIYSIGIHETYGPIVEVVDISQEEYEVYSEEFSKGTEVSDSVYQDLINRVDVLEYVVNLKVAEMSSICNQSIINGVDVKLTDGKTYHFSLTSDDQLNLSTMLIKLVTGTEVFGYHNDNGDCEFYSKEDVAIITKASEDWKLYHVTYFNSLRKYIRSIKTVKEVREVYYGMSIPEEYQTPVLKAILGGANG